MWFILLLFIVLLRLRSVHPSAVMNAYVSVVPIVKYTNLTTMCASKTLLSPRNIRIDQANYDNSIQTLEHTSDRK